MNTDLTTMTAKQREQETQSMIATETARVTAEIQAQLTVAQKCPRDVQQSINKLTVSCQRVGLARNAGYQMARGGNDIEGPGIRLLEACAAAWGNIDYGFRELSSGNGESTVEAYAHDLESNTKEKRTFIVPHAMKAGKSIKKLTDPQDISYHIANQSQRRVRSCLEHVIPFDIVEEAYEECKRTLKAKVNLTPERIKEMVEKFEEFGVSREQIEAKLQRSVTSITPASFMMMTRIFVALRDEVSEVSDHFKPIEEEKGDSLAQKLRTAAKGKGAAKPAETPPAAAQEPTKAKTTEEQAKANRAAVSPPIPHLEPEMPPTTAKKRRKRRTKAEIAADEAAAREAEERKAAGDRLKAEQAAEQPEDPRDVADPFTSPPQTPIEKREREQITKQQNDVIVPDLFDEAEDDGQSDNWEDDVDELKEVIHGGEDVGLMKKVFENVAQNPNIPTALIDSLGRQLQERVKALTE